MLDRKKITSPNEKWHQSSEEGVDRIWNSKAIEHEKFGIEKKGE